MGRKDKQFAKSQAWLDWLSDEKTANHAATLQKTARTPLGSSKAAQALPPRSYAQRPPVRPVQAPSSRSLGLDTSAFRSSPQAHQVNPKVKKSRKAKKQSSPVATNTDGTITINFHLPAVKLPKVKVNWRKAVLYSGVGIVVAGLTFGTPFIIKAISGHKSTGVAKDTSISDKPAFATIVPSKDISDYVQASQTYDAAKQIYHFSGHYKDVEVVGTEQALPEVFKTNKNMLKDQAARIGATERIDVVGGVAYVSPGEGNTSQRAVYASSQILVFVTYSGVMKDSEWVKFIQSLE